MLPTKVPAILLLSMVTALGGTVLAIPTFATEPPAAHRQLPGTSSEQPDFNQPVNSEVTGHKPDTKHPDTKHPEIKEPGIKEPETKDSANEDTSPADVPGPPTHSELEQAEFTQIEPDPPVEAAGPLTLEEERTALAPSSPPGPERQPHLGIFHRPSNKRITVIGIRKGSAASVARIQLGDEIVAIDGAKLSSFDELLQCVARKLPGDAIVLRVHRNGHELDQTVILGIKPPHHGSAQ